ncbi:MAG: hypothetical protein CVU81_00450 [Euryarchaeota archaeon HGW-Euryarchaeota-1]|nr:MAG: hypothetical protein CVU81_00450 [Euryarchaeota archaeon HGW-Euryarchaeota-1]
MVAVFKDSIVYAVYFLGLLAPLFLIPLGAAIYFEEWKEAIGFGIVLLIMLIFWTISRKHLAFKTFSKKEYLLVLFFVFPIAAFVCSIPFLFGGFSIFNAVFDAMSSFTTTGISFHTGEICNSLLFFRSFLVWLGGLGFVFFAFLVLKQSFQERNINSYYNEIKEKSGFNLNNFSKKIFSVYLLLTLACFVLLFLSGMTWFEAINLAAVTLSTGGFFWSSSFSDIQKVILIIFMLLGASCFILFFVRKNFVKAFARNIEFRSMLVFIFLGSCAFVFFSDINIIDAVFLAVSGLTGTGLIANTIDLSQLSQLILLVLIGLMVIGGSYSSTSGGLKIWRVIIFFKSIFAEIKKYLLPDNVVVPLVFDGQCVEEKEIKNVFIYIGIFFLVL